MHSSKYGVICIWLQNRATGTISCDTRSFELIFQNKTTNNHIAQDTTNPPALNIGKGGSSTGVLIDVLGDLGGESTTDPTNDLSTLNRGGGGGLGGGLGLGLESIVGSGVPEDNFNK